MDTHMYWKIHTHTLANTDINTQETYIRIKHTHTGKYTYAYTHTRKRIHTCALAPCTYTRMYAHTHFCMHHKTNVLMCAYTYKHT